MRTFEKIALEITLREGGEEEVNIAQTRSVLSHLSDMMAEDEAKHNTDTASGLLANGIRRRIERENGGQDANAN